MEPEIRARRSHTKSKGGCGNCRRRHLRCDLYRPQWVECDFTTLAESESESASSSSNIPEINFRPNAQQEIADWVARGRLDLPMMPPEAQLPPDGLSHDELRLLHHCCAVFSECAESDTAKMTIWTGQLPIFLALSRDYDYVLHALLALSATHISWITKSTKADKYIFHHRDIAYKGLQSGIESFTPGNSDGVMGASLALSWQMDTQREWATFVDGIAKTYSAMQPWKHESKFAFFLDEEAQTPPPALELVHSEGLLMPPDEPKLIISRIRTSLEGIQPFLAGYEEQTNMVQQLLVFTENLTIAPPGPNKHDQLNTLAHVRTWLAWLPESCLHLRGRDTFVLLAFAQLYMVTLAVNPLFHAIGPGYFTAMRAYAILNIHEALLDRVENDRDSPLKKEELEMLMKQPLNAAARFAAQKHYGTVVGIEQDVGQMSSGLQWLNMPLMEQ